MLSVALITAVASMYSSGIKSLIKKEYTKEMEKAKYQTAVNSYLIGLEIDPLGVSSIGGLAVVVGIIIGIIVFTSVFCIKNSFDISITEKTKQYGMLRSIVATKKQIKRNVFYEATVLGLIGIPLGILLGFLASFILCIISNYFLDGSLSEGLRLEFSFSWLAVLVSIVVSVFVFIVLSGFMSMAFDTVENELQLSDYNIMLSSTSIYDSSEDKYNKFIDTTKLDNIEDYTILREVGFQYENRRFNPEYIKWLDLQLDHNIILYFERIKIVFKTFLY